MQYVLYVLLIGVMFGLVALGDFLLKKLFPRRTGKAVRLPRRSFMIGILMTVFAVFILLFLPLENEWLLTVGAVILLLIGLFLLVYFFRTSIIYDETGFSFPTLTTKARFYRYADIT